MKYPKDTTDLSHYIYEANSNFISFSLILPNSGGGSKSNGSFNVGPSSSGAGGSWGSAGSVGESDASSDEAGDNGALNEAEEEAEDEEQEDPRDYSEGEMPGPVSRAQLNF